MPDAIFADPRLAQLYDAFEGVRNDLPHYLRIAREVGATRVLDICCGTGAFAILAADAGIQVTGVDPAAASLDVAQGKVGADKVTWCLGDATALSARGADLAVMIGNVAQVFLTDDSWHATLSAVRDSLTPGGHLVYETRQLGDRAWDRWLRDTAVTTRLIGDVGRVAHQLVVDEVALPFVTFRHEYTFPSGERIGSASTLRFRSEQENLTALTRAGFSLVDVREAPDRPGREHVYLAANWPDHNVTPPAGRSPS